jgi:pimeloyl-ACP methyl ester carboxylesterase
MVVYHTAAGTVEMLEWGEGPELFVLLHAAAAGPQSLSALAELLLQPGRRVIAPALDRYGATLMREAARVRANVAVLHACVEIYPADRCVLIGHSMGGLISLLGSLDDVPMDSMALYEPIVTSCLRANVPHEAALLDWDRSIVADVERCIAAGDPEAGIAAFITAWNETPWNRLPSGVRARLIASAGLLAADIRAVSYCELAVNDLRRVQTPVLLLQGAASPAITRAMSARLCSLLPRAQQVTVEGCGHMGPVQMTAAIASAIHHC